MRHAPRDFRKPGPPPVQLGDGLKEAFGVRMPRFAEQRSDRGLFHDLAAIHDQHSVGRLRHNTQVVSDEQDRGSQLLLQRGQKAEDLRLDGHIERGRRLVRDQEGRAGRERHRDHHPLPHAAGELVGVVAVAPLGLGDPHAPEPLDRLPPDRGRAALSRAPAERPVRPDRLGHLVADREHRIQAGHRLLEDHADLASPDLAEPPLARADQLLSSQPHARTGKDTARRLGNQTQDGERRDGLSAARLADERKRLAFTHLERDAIHGARLPSLGREVGAQAPHLQERLARHDTGLSVTTRRSPVTRRVSGRGHRAARRPRG